jgi:hypothetical protein
VRQAVAGHRARRADGRVVVKERFWRKDDLINFSGFILDNEIQHTVRAADQPISNPTAFVSPCHGPRFQQISASRGLVAASACCHPAPSFGISCQKFEISRQYRIIIAGD